MENELLSYVKGILCFVLFSSLILQLFPSTKDKKYLELTLGLILVYLVIRPVLTMFTHYDEILRSSYFTVNLNSDFLGEGQEEFKTQTGVALMNQMEQQLEVMGYANSSLSMRKKGNDWVLNIKVEENLSNDWEEEKKNLKNFISNVYNFEEDNINIEIRG